MKLFLYYDIDLILSFIAQMIKNEPDIEFFALVLENRNEENNRYAIDPCKNQEKCSVNMHFSNNTLVGMRKEFIYANIDEIKTVKNNKFMYNLLNKIEDYIVVQKKSRSGDSFYHSKFKSRDNDDLKFLFTEENYKIKDETINNSDFEKKITFGVKIDNKLIKPICTYVEL